jgi:hypothetical protein
MSRIFEHIFTRLIAVLFIAVLILLAPLAAAKLFLDFYKDYPQGAAWGEASDIAAIISGLVTALGILAASWAFFRRSRDERERHENQTHHELNKRYAEYLELALAHPELPVQDYGEDKSWSQKVGGQFDSVILKGLGELTLPEYKKTVAIYEILYTLMERAYITYAAHTDQFRKNQWNGWNTYIADWLDREDFRLVWERHIRSADNDSNFTKYIESIAGGNKEIVANL